MISIIEKNIPIPPKYSWRSMLDKLEFGESFSFDKEKQANVANAVSAYFHKETNKRFYVGADPKNPEMSRVWRIEDVEDTNA